MVTRVQKYSDTINHTFRRYFIILEDEKDITLLGTLEIILLVIYHRDYDFHVYFKLSPKFYFVIAENIRVNKTKIGRQKTVYSSIKMKQIGVLMKRDDRC